MIGTISGNTYAENITEFLAISMLKVMVENSIMIRKNYSYETGL